ncbi:Mobile element protein [Pseudonocardia sp. Ae168_Ps1]|nr:Mobile element protein [Pseudonocardia sp. Ae168_Ps1]
MVFLFSVLMLVSSSAGASEAAVMQLVGYSDGACVAAPGLRHGPYPRILDTGVDYAAVVVRVVRSVCS